MALRFEYPDRSVPSRPSKTVSLHICSSIYTLTQRGPSRHPLESSFPFICTPRNFGLCPPPKAIDGHMITGITSREPRFAGCAPLWDTAPVPRHGAMHSEFATVVALAFY